MCDGDCFLFHRRGAIAGGGTFEKIFSQERTNATQSLVLRGVNQFVQKKISILPAIGAHKDAVTHSESAWFRRQKIDRVVGGLQHWMSRGRNRVDLQESYSFGIAHTNRFGIGNFLVGKWDALTQNSLFLFACPLRRERNELVKLLLRKLLRHVEKTKQESGRSMSILKANKRPGLCVRNL